MLEDIFEPMKVFVLGDHLYIKHGVSMDGLLLSGNYYVWATNTL